MKYSSILARLQRIGQTSQMFSSVYFVQLHPTVAAPHRLLTDFHKIFHLYCLINISYTPSKNNLSGGGYFLLPVINFFDIIIAGGGI